MIFRVFLRKTGASWVIDAPSEAWVRGRLATGQFPCRPIQTAHHTSPEAVGCVLCPGATLHTAQAEIPPELALWGKSPGVTANLTYTRPTYADIQAVAGDLWVPLDELWLELQAGKSLTEAVQPTRGYDPLLPVQYGHPPQTYRNLHHFASLVGVPVERLYWMHDRRCLTPEQIALQIRLVRSQNRG